MNLKKELNYNKCKWLQIDYSMAKTRNNILQKQSLYGT